MTFDPNPLFYWMLKKYAEWDSNDKLVICNEGGSRSSKTWDTFHLLVYICWHTETPLSIYVLRNTLTECRDKTFDDFLKFARIVGIYDNNAYVTSPKPNYKIGNHIIKFRGLDDEKDTEGFPSDITFLNEALELPTESKITGIFMRCTRLFIADWNPKFTAHWIFKWEKRDNVFFTRTTYLNNKHCPEAVVKELKGYEPTKQNIEQGTANEYRYKVYTLGQRGSMDGLVFPDVIWVDSLDYETDKIMYGLDFGNTTGTFAFAEVYTNGNNLYADCPIYSKFATKEDIVTDKNSGLLNFYEVFKSYLKEKELEKTEMFIISDSANPDFITNLNIWSDRDGYNCKFLPVKKYSGCVTARIDKMNRYKMHLVKRDWVIEEQENYAYLEINGIKTNQPKKGNDHFFDALGYAFQYY